MDFMVADQADIDEYNSLANKILNILPVAGDLCALGKVDPAVVRYLQFVISAAGGIEYDPKYAGQVQYYISLVHRADEADEREYQRALRDASPKGYRGTSSISRISKRKVSK